jgi:hypothetical protein
VRGGSAIKIRGDGDQLAQRNGPEEGQPEEAESR